MPSLVDFSTHQEHSVTGCFVETAFCMGSRLHWAFKMKANYKISVIMKMHEHVPIVCFMKTVYQINNLITWSDNQAGSPVCIRKLPCGNWISLTEIDVLNITFCPWRLISVSMEVKARLALCWPVTCRLFTRFCSPNVSIWMRSEGLVKHIFSFTNRYYSIITAQRHAKLHSQRSIVSGLSEWLME